MKKTVLFFMLITFVAFSSCGKEDGLKDEKDYDKTDLDGKDEKEACLELVYPVIYTMPDGSEVSGAGEKEVWTAIKDWYEANPDSEEKPALSYPVEVVFEDGSTENVIDEESMILIKKDCEDWEEDDLELCEWDEAVETSGPGFEKFVVKELEYSEDCGCYVSGIEKFLENGITKYLIYYKSDDCVGYGYKVTCEDGDCDKKGTKCKFLQDCEGN